MPWPWASADSALQTPRLSVPEVQPCLRTITSSAVQLQYADVEACALVADGCSSVVSATSGQQAGYQSCNLAGQAVALLHMRYLSPAGDLYSCPYLRDTVSGCCCCHMILNSQISVQGMYLVFTLCDCFTKSAQGSRLRGLSIGDRTAAAI